MHETETAMTEQTDCAAPAVPVIQVKNLHKSFTLHTQGGIKLDVLSSTDLTVAAGDCVALMGALRGGKVDGAALPVRKLSAAVG